MALELANKLARKGVGVHLFSSCLPLSPDPNLLKGYPIHIARSFNHPILDDSPQSWCITSKMIEIGLSSKIQVYHVHTGLPYALCGLLSRVATGIPYVATLHGDDVHTIGVRRNVKTCLELTLSGADTITVATSYMRNILRRKFSVSHVEVIPNFVDTRIFSRRAVRRSEDPTIIHASNLMPNKRIEFLLRVFGRIQRHLKRARLIVVGDGPSKSSAEMLTKRLRLRHVAFVGERRDMVRLLNMSDVLLMTSLKENMPLIMLEAMSCGVPVVSTNVGGIPEFLLHGRNGYLAPVHDEDSLVSLTISLLSDPSLRGRMGEWAREDMAKDFSTEAVIPEYIKIYKSIIG